jgi:hypothetical protein
MNFPEQPLPGAKKGGGVTTVEQENVQHTLHVMDQTGDTRTTWDPANQVEVEAAAKLFKRLKKRGYLAYTVDPTGSKGDVIQGDVLPEGAVAVIMSPQMQGG